MFDSVLAENPPRSGGIEIVPADEGYIVYDQGNDRVHCLNPVASLILELCTGDKSAEQIAELVQGAYGLVEAPSAEVEETLAKMKVEGLLR